MGDEAAVRALIGRAEKTADIVVAFFHAGAEGAGKTRVPRGPETAFGEYRGDSRRFARAAIDAGADLVLGSGPHVLRGLELYEDRLIAYSLGNLAGWKNFSTAGRSGLSALLTVTVEPRGRFVRARLDSLRLDGSGVPRRDPQGAAAKLVRSLSRADFPRSPLRIDRRGTVTAVERKG
jgi:Bacterial capsule synthesis protein PGA_cap